MATNKNKEVIGYDPLAWLGLDNADAEHADENTTNQDEISDEAELDFAESADSVEEVDAVEKEAQLIDKDCTEEDTAIFSGDDFAQVEGVEVDDNNPIDLDIELAGTQDEKTIEIADDSMSTDEAVVDFSDNNIDLESAMAEQELSPIVDLEHTLTIQHVSALHEKLKLCLALYDEVEINASDVSSIDTASLQLLVALKKDADNLQKRVTIIYPSPRFVESAQLLGLLDILEVAA